MGQRWKILVGGQWVETGNVVNVVNPFNGETVAEVCRAGAEEAEKALQMADASKDIIAKLPSFKKSEILMNISSGIIERKEELARTITLECGKPIKESRVEVDRAALTFRLGSEETDRTGGEFVPLDRNAVSAGRWGITRRFPAGPVFGITPFNFPLNLVAHKASPAIASGNPLILKPASITPVTSLILGEIIMESGFPHEGISVVPCDPKTAEKIAQDERIKVLSFTGSASVGWTLKSRVPQKRVLLELGGNAGVVVDDNADISYAVKRCVTGAFSYAGQVCISVQRIYLHEKIFDRFMDEFVPLVKGLKLGDPLLDSTDVGPMIDEGNIERVEAWVGEAVEKGARILTGGKREGRFYLPTVLMDATPEMKVSCMEVFAPVVTVAKVKDFDEGLTAVNSTVYGLQAGVFTKDMKNAFSAFEKLEVGGVIINDVPTYRVDHMPYGGVKQSGFGREGIRYAIEEMTELRLMALNLM